MNRIDTDTSVKKIRYEDEERIRLDVFLARKEITDYSRSRIKELIDLGHILINEKIVKASYILKKDDLITLTIPENKELELRAEDIPLSIYYEDEHILIIDKAAGMIVHPTGKVSSGTLVNALLFHCGFNISAINGVNRPGIVHRLDKETSGLMMIAKTELAHKILSQQIKDREVIKKYIALVNGNVKNEMGCIEAPIGRDPNHGNKMTVTDIGGRYARTTFQVIKKFSHHTLLLVNIYTGRTHQIRVHLNFIGHPVVGDKIYGFREKKDSLVIMSRHALHSHYLEIVHPIQHQKISFTSPLPEDFLNQLDILSDY